MRFYVIKCNGDAKEKKRTFTLDSKINVINAVEEGKKTKTKIARDFEINPSTLSMFLKQKCVRE